MPLQMVNETDAEKLVRLKDSPYWLDKNHKRFEKNHKNQFVAIKDKSFLDKDIELEALVKRRDKRLMIRLQ